ncbi:LytR/AlgR family response regulator transcription factor [Flammeovirga agarivorans]|uniref:Response regulator transcription factor n=1 Tax=Flammeovirga agarivorans TaxID=2726742 RepID=A0A7X8XYR0_9BACT|nr:response regulator transcription factor [Flammeovirga agarivorans]NLR94459.1 response regulator transcription factor [Flammeovirga agarivorans]
MITCIIVEDQAPAQKILKNYIQKTDQLSLLNTFSDAIEAKEFIEEHPVDLMFLDINLPQLSGIEFLKSLKNSPVVILTTAFSDYALESYQYRVIDYLLKPFSYDRFILSINKALSLLNYSSHNEVIFIKSRNDIIKIKHQDIFYIKSDVDYTEIFTTSKKYLSSSSLKEWNHKLDNTFCQVHRSYIVNLEHLLKISQNKVHLSNEEVIPIGRAYKKEFMEKCN